MYINGVIQAILDFEKTAAKLPTYAISREAMAKYFPDLLPFLKKTEKSVGINRLSKLTQQLRASRQAAAAAKSPAAGKELMESLRNFYGKIPAKPVLLPIAGGLAGGGIGYGLGDEEGALMGALAGAGGVAGAQQLPKLLSKKMQWAAKHPNVAAALSGIGAVGAGLGAGYRISELAGLNEEPWYAI